MKKKVYANAAEGLDGLLSDGMTIAAGGFGLCGIPESLIAALRDCGVKDLTVVSNNAGVDGFGLGAAAADAADQEDDLVLRRREQGVHAPVPGRRARARVQAAGHARRADARGRRRHPGLLHATGVGTIVAEGKEHKEFDGETYVLERGIVADLPIVKAWKGDEPGNLVFRKTARNFNPNAATCGKVCVAEVEEIVPLGSLDPDGIHTPGIFVHRIVAGPAREAHRTAHRARGLRRNRPCPGPRPDGRPRRARNSRTAST